MDHTVVRTRVGVPTLGPVRSAGASVRLRPPAYGDHARWRELRLRDQALIEPYWPTSSLTWQERHTEQVWVREVLDARGLARRGTGLGWVIEVDGQMCGQLQLSELDLRRGTAEAGVWVGSDVARRGAAGLALSMVLDEAFGPLGLSRVTAPVSSDNVATQRGALTVGMTCEAEMRGYFHAGGSLRDHLLFGVLAQDAPDGGFTAAWLARRASRRDDVSSQRSATDGQPGAPVSWAGRVEAVRHVVRTSARLPRQRHRAEAPGRRTTPEGGGLRHVRSGLGEGELWWPGSVAGDELVRLLRGHVTTAWAAGLHRVVARVHGHAHDAALQAAGLRHEGTLRSVPGDDLVPRDVELWAAVDPDHA